jgi:hypothetical protein
MKTVSVKEAVALIPDGASLMIGGFMGVGRHRDGSGFPAFKYSYHCRVSDMPDPCLAGRCSSSFFSAFSSQPF